MSDVLSCKMYLQVDQCRRKLRKPGHIYLSSRVMVAPPVVGLATTLENIVPVDDAPMRHDNGSQARQFAVPHSTPKPPSSRPKFTHAT